ncbi:hypothetical protein [Noviherbaspirillum suwonense]|uniref:Cytochrome c domain-containing protein n=1 Tax=Noviherbaspirillum suwonense TaxID=1224511 RepID=A0ABY1Q919_9BURK|nr:hypothetical protein [Noviherbaspirillum suwonense]SMP63571.1 hypothetical protein SAMN06295970_109102 [Noviherbaspirillum suwonense]
MLKTRIRCMPVMAVALASLTAAPGVRADHGVRGGIDFFAEIEQVKRGYEIVPRGVHLNLAGKNRVLVGLGSYIVNTSGCNDCHTRPSYLPTGDPFNGYPELVNYQQYLTGGRTFGPKITAPNLTPDGEGKPAGLTLPEFIETLRTGHNPHDPPDKILQVMPWPVYGKKTERELAAIYEFLRALPSLPNNRDEGP